MKSAPQCGSGKSRSPTVRPYTLLCIYKSSKQTGNNSRACACGNRLSCTPLTQAGALHPVAVTSAKRYVKLPDTTTIAELGIAGFDAEAWWGLLAPAKTPNDVIVRMNAAMAKALRDPLVERSLNDHSDQQLATDDGEIAHPRRQETE